jgi:hypothetical protein
MPVCIDSFRRKCLLARMFRMHKGNELPIKPRTFSNDVLCIPFFACFTGNLGAFRWFFVKRVITLPRLVSSIVFTQIRHLQTKDVCSQLCFQLP